MAWTQNRRDWNHVDMEKDESIRNDNSWIFLIVCPNSIRSYESSNIIFVRLNISSWFTDSASLIKSLESVVMCDLKRFDHINILIILSKDSSTIADIKQIYLQGSDNCYECSCSTELCLFSFVVKEIWIGFLYYFVNYCLDWKKGIFVLYFLAVLEK